MNDGQNEFIINNYVVIDITNQEKNEFVRNRLRLESIDYYWLYVKSD